MNLTNNYLEFNMNREFILGLCKERYGTEPDYPFNDKYNSAVLRHSDTRKWYGVILNVLPKVFGLSGEEKVDVINLKIDPIMMGSLPSLVSRSIVMSRLSILQAVSLLRGLRLVVPSLGMAVPHRDNAWLLVSTMSWAAMNKAMRA